jgi:ferritin-like metal-binding protein YciE
MAINSLNDLLSKTLQDVLYSEQSIQKAIPALADKSTNPELKKALKDHLTKTEAQIKRLEKVFTLVKKPASSTQSVAIDGILAEAKSVAAAIDDQDVRDAGILAAIQEIEHYGIARYGTLLAWADQLSLKEASLPLRDSLNASKELDRALTKIAETRVNRLAAA